jgi:hypothetical protein
MQVPIAQLLMSDDMRRHFGNWRTSFELQTAIKVPVAGKVLELVEKRTCPRSTY